VLIDSGRMHELALKAAVQGGGAANLSGAECGSLRAGQASKMASW
jgi:hypothetical protein